MLTQIPVEAADVLQTSAFETPTAMKTQAEAELLAEMDQQTPGIKKQSTPARHAIPARCARCHNSRWITAALSKEVDTRQTDVPSTMDVDAVALAEEVCGVDVVENVA